MAEALNSYKPLNLLDPIQDAEINTEKATHKHVRLNRRINFYDPGFLTHTIYSMCKEYEEILTPTIYSRDKIKKSKKKKNSCNSGE